MLTLQVDISNFSLQVLYQALKENPSPKKSYKKSQSVEANFSINRNTQKAGDDCLLSWVMYCIMC